MADDLSNRNYFKAGWDFRDRQEQAGPRTVQMSLRLSF